MSFYKRTALYICFLIIIFLSNLAYALNSPFISPEIEKQFIQDLSSQLPGIGDINTIKAILITAYNKEYSKAISTAVSSKIEDKLKTLLGALSPLLTTAKVEYYVMNYYKHKLDAKAFELLMNAYKNMSPADKKKLLYGNERIAMDTLYDELLIDYKPSLWDSLLRNYTSRKEQLWKNLIQLVRDEERQKKAFERLKKRVKKLTYARLYFKCILSFIDPETKNYELVNVIIKKNKKTIGQRHGWIITLTLKRLREGEEYKFEYVPERRKFFKKGFIKLTYQDVPLANMAMRMLYKKIRVILKPTKEYKKYLEEERKKQREKELQEEKKQIAIGSDPWPDTIAYKDKVIRAYEKALQKLKQGKITFRKFHDIYLKLRSKFYPKYGICPRWTKQELIYSTYSIYCNYMKKLGKKPSYEEWLKKHKEIVEKYRKICEPRVQQWNKWKKEFYDRFAKDSKRIDEEKKKIVRIYDLDYKQLDNILSKFLSDYISVYRQKKSMLNKLSIEYKKAYGYEKLKIARKGYNLCIEFNDFIEDSSDKFCYIADKWRQKAYDAFETSLGILSKDYLANSIEEMKTLLYKKIQKAPESRLYVLYENIYKNHTFSLYNPIALIVKKSKNGLSCSLWKWRYTNEENKYIIYKGIYPSQVYNWCKQNLSKISKLRENLIKFNRLISLKNTILYWEKKHKKWEIYSISNIIEEYIHLLNSITHIKAALKTEIIFLQRYKFYAKHKFLSYYNAKRRNIIVKCFSIPIPAIIMEKHIYTASTFDKFVKQIRTQTQKIVSLYLKEKKYIPKISEAAYKYYSLKRMSNNIEANWLGILEIEKYFHLLNPKDKLLKELKKDAESLLYSISKQLNSILNKKIIFLHNFLNKIKKAQNEAALNRLETEYVNNIFPALNKDFTYPLYKRIKNLTKEVWKAISNKRKQFTKKEKVFVDNLQIKIIQLTKQKHILEKQVNNISPQIAINMIEQFILTINNSIKNAENFSDTCSSPKTRALINKLRHLKDWAIHILENIKRKVNAISKIRKLYNQFAYYYKTKNLGALIELLSDNWTAYDGTTLDEMEDILDNSFDIFDSIEYYIYNFRVKPIGNGKFIVSYRNEIVGRIFSEGIVHREKGQVVEEVGIEDGKFKILRTIQGSFWKISNR